MSRTRNKRSIDDRPDDSAPKEITKRPRTRKKEETKASQSKKRLEEKDESKLNETDDETDCDEENEISDFEDEPKKRLNKEISVQFSAFDPIENDLSGIRCLLQQLWLKENVSCAELADLIINETISTVLKQSYEFDEDQNENEDGYEVKYFEDYNENDNNVKDFEEGDENGKETKDFEDDYKNDSESKDLKDDEENYVEIKNLEDEDGNYEEVKDLEDDEENYDELQELVDDEEIDDENEDFEVDDHNDTDENEDFEVDDDNDTDENEDLEDDDENEDSDDDENEDLEDDEENYEEVKKFVDDEENDDETEDFEENDENEDFDEDNDDSVFGVISFIPFNSYFIKKPCVRQIKELLMSYLPEDNEIRKKLNDPDVKCALIINERLINLPAKISVPCYRQMLIELNNYKKHNNKNFDFDFVIMVSKLSKYKTEFIFANGEDEIFCERSEATYEYSVARQSDYNIMGWDDYEDEERIFEPFRKILMLTKAKWIRTINLLKDFV